MESFITKEQYDIARDIVDKYHLQQSEIASSEGKYWLKHYTHFIGLKKEDKLIMAISMRLANKLNTYFKWEEIAPSFDLQSSTIETLEKVSLSKFKDYRGAGAKTVEELKALCFYAEIKIKP